MVLLFIVAVSDLTSAFPPSPIPTGIPLKGHYWETQQPQRVAAKEAISKSLLTNAFRMSRSNCCVRCLNWMPCSFSTNSVNIENVRHNANQHNDWRSKLWLYVEAPHSSTAARWIRNCRLLFTLLALALVFAETSPTYNLYGPDSRACKATVNHYCNWISECASTSSCKNKWTDTHVDGFTQEKIDMVNVGCFPNATSGYGGCVGGMGGQYKMCDFPNEPLGMTMGENIFGRSFLKHLGKRDGSKKMVAGRIQCTEGKNKISYGLTFWTAELVLTIIFVLELATRLVVATAPDELNWTDWFSDVGNWIDIAAVTTALIEIIGNSVDFGMAEYQVWGWMWNHSTDPGTFRFLRIVVAVRFMLQQRHFRVRKFSCRHHVLCYFFMTPVVAALPSQRKFLTSHFFYFFLFFLFFSVLFLFFFFCSFFVLFLFFF